MIRPVVLADTPALVVLSGSSGLFKSDELGSVQDMMDEYHATNSKNGQMLAWDEGGTL